MAEAWIPVDIFNLGQVLGCMGFLELADVLLGEAEGGFDWRDATQTRFSLRADGEENPFASILSFLRQAEVRVVAPCTYVDTLDSDGDEDDEAGPNVEEVDLVDAFPSASADKMALPIRLVGAGGTRVTVGHWSDGTSRNSFKLYSGNRSGAGIALAMLKGTREKPKKGQSIGDRKTSGLAGLVDTDMSLASADPFGVLTLVGGSFNLDPRGAWTAIDAGYSPNTQKHGLRASPIVEILGAIGLENARPLEAERRRVNYSVWGAMLPPALARPALGCSKLPVPVRNFFLVLGMSGKNKVVTYAQEETHS